MSRLLELVVFKAYAELKADASRYYANFLWWLIEPLIYMAAFYLIFGVLFQRGGEGFVPFLLCGLVAWKWFASTVNQGSTAILSNGDLIRRVYIHKFVFPGAVLLTNTIRFFFVFIIFVFFLYVYGILPGSAWLALLPLLLIQFLLNAACGCLASALVPLVPDVKQLIEKILMLGFFMSGVFFDITRIPKQFQICFLLNPMAVLIRGYRSIMLHGQWPDWQALTWITLFSVMLIGVALLLMNKYDRLYPKVL